MKLDREAFLVLCAGIAACHHEAASGATPTTVTLPAPTPTTAAPSGDACAALARENLERLTHPRGACPTDESARVAAIRAKLVEAAKDGLFATCRVGGGTWAVLVRDVELSEPAGESGSYCGASARWRLVFIDPKTNARVESPDFAWASFPDSDAHATIDAIYDFDGDGASEVVVTDEDWENGGGTTRHVTAWRSEAGKAIEPYPIGFHVTGTLDADGDGRPDFVDEGYFETTPPCFGLYPVARRGVPLLVHGLPNGTFTMSDDTSRRWARAQCPSAPATGASEPTVASCMRLWGKSPPDIARGLSNTPDFCGEPKSSERDVTLALVTRTAPFPTLDVNTPPPLPKR